MTSKQVEPNVYNILATTGDSPSAGASGVFAKDFKDEQQFSRSESVASTASALAAESRRPTARTFARKRVSRVVFAAPQNPDDRRGVKVRARPLARSAPGFRALFRVPRFSPRARRSGSLAGSASVPSSATSVGALSVDLSGPSFTGAQFRAEAARAWPFLRCSPSRVARAIVFSIGRGELQPFHLDARTARSQPRLVPHPHHEGVTHDC